MSSASNTGGLITGTGFSSQCFPVRSLTRFRSQDDDGGAWLVAYRAEQRRRFKAVLCSGEPAVPPERLIKKLKRADTAVTEDETPKKLDGFYLMKQFHVDDPSDLCTIRIRSQELREVSENDFLLFDNVVHVDAGDNNLPFAAFHKFPALQELELPLNNISNNIRVESDMFMNLAMLDLSYNRLTGDDILAVGLLCSLRTLHLTGNEIKELPIELTRTYRTVMRVTHSGTVESHERRLRFPALENLYLDHNELTDLSTFASLAGLRKLKYLNLDHNEISSVPYLRLLGARVRQGDGSGQSNHEKTDSKDDNGKQHGEDFLPRSRENSKDEESREQVDFSLDEVDEMLTRNFVDDGHVGVQRLPEMEPRTSSLTEDPSLLGERFNPPMPFPSLLHLNLANNLIFEEEGLLALTSWPYLKELVIWGNPLTTAFRGDPPILSLQLGKLKGVRIFRKKPPKRPKPIVNLASTHRKVNDSLPPMPKKQNLAMLEAPPKPEPVAYVGPTYKTIPPIGSAPPTGRRYENVTPWKPSTAPGKSETVLEGNRVPSPPAAEPHQQPDHATRQTMRTEGGVTVAESVLTDVGRQQPRAVTQLKSEDGFFMTQVGDLEGGEEGEPVKKKPAKLKEREKDGRPFSVETKYKGYEDLLDVDEHDPDIIIPKDVQGSVRALKYALGHTLVFSDPQGKYKERPVRKNKHMSVSTGRRTRQSKVEELGSILDKMRVQSKTTESNLETVLQDFKKNPKFRQEYREAKKLLDEVQTKYNEVRVASLKPSATARKLFGSQSKREASKEAQEGASSVRAEKKIAKEIQKFKQNIDSRI